MWFSCSNLSTKLMDRSTVIQFDYVKLLNLTRVRDLHSTAREHILFTVSFSLSSVTLFLSFAFSLKEWQRQLRLFHFAFRSNHESRFDSLFAIEVSVKQFLFLYTIIWTIMLHALKQWIVNHHIYSDEAVWIWRSSELHCISLKLFCCFLVFIQSFEVQASDFWSVYLFIFRQNK